MAQTKYTYSIATDTVNAKVVPVELIDEINAEGSGVSITVDFISTQGADVLEIHMADIMPDDIAGESASLKAVVNLHTGTKTAETIQTVKIDTKMNGDGVIEFQPAKSYSDSSKSFTTPDFSTRQSWWFDTVQVTDELLTADVTFKIYTTTRAEYATGWGAAWINWKKIPNNARQTKPQLKVVVKLNDVAVTTGFTVEHATGVVTFEAANIEADTVKVSYCYAKSSCFELTPTAGKKLLVDYVETQFSVACDPIPEGCYIIFQAIYNGPAIPSMGIPANYDIPVKTYEYHSGADFMNESTRAFVCDPFMELQKKQNILPWDYLTGHTLKPAGDPTTNLAKGEFNKLKCQMVGEKLIGNCEIATGTFYCVVEDL